MNRMRLDLTRIVFVLLLFAATVTTANSQLNRPNGINLDALAVRGEALANEDPLALELRNLQPDDSARRGFDIGMGVAEGHTLPGPGKDRTCASLPAGGPQGCSIAVLFSVERNRAVLYSRKCECNVKLAAIGAKIAHEDHPPDPALWVARNGEPNISSVSLSVVDVFYRLGFDIATGIFGPPALGAQGNVATGPGSLKIRDSLSPAGQRGFNASVKFHLGQDAPPSPAPERPPRTPGEVTSIDKSAVATQADNFVKRSAAPDKAYQETSQRLILSAEGSYGFQPVPSAKLYLGQRADGEIWLAISYEDGTPFTQARAGDIHIRTLKSGSGVEAKLDPSLSRPDEGIWHFTLPEIDSGSHFYLISVLVDIKAWRTTYEGRTIVRATYTRMPFWNAQRVDGTIWQPPE